MNKKKYTLQQCKDQNIAIWCTTAEQGNKIYNAWGYKGSFINFKFRGGGFEVAYHIGRSWQGGFNKTYFVSEHGFTKCINFNQLIDFEEFVLPEKWWINLSQFNESSKERKITIDWLNEGCGGDYYKMNECTPGKYLGVHFPNFRSCVGFERGAHTGDKRPDYIEITFEQFQKHVLKQDKNMQIKGYKLIKKYPGCKKELGYVEPYTTGEFSSYPEFWQPIYQELTKTLVLGTNKIKIVLRKNKAEVDGDEFNISDLRLLINAHISAVKRYSMTSYPVTLLDARYKIGCSEFTLAEIKLIVDTYDSLQK